MPTAIKQAGALNLHHAALLVMLAGGNGRIVPVPFVRAIWGRLQQGPDGGDRTLPKIPARNQKISPVCVRSGRQLG